MTRAKTKIDKDTTKNIREVFTTEDVAEANRRLANGWTLLHGGVSHRDDAGYNVKPVFVLGRMA